MKFEELKGKTLVEIVGGVGDKSMLFVADDLQAYELYHDQD